LFFEAITIIPITPRKENSRTCLQILLGVAVAVVIGLLSHTAQEVELEVAQMIARTNVVGVGLIEGEVEGSVAVSFEAAAVRRQLKFIGLYFLLFINFCSFS
jgi:hypothetical protein